MPEGDRDFRDWAGRIAAIAAAVPVPVIVKEVGFGLSRRTIGVLERTGVAAVDVAGAGGTDFIAIENERRPGQEYSYLTGWGQSAVLCLLSCNSGCKGDRPFCVASQALGNQAWCVRLNRM